MTIFYDTFFCAGDRGLGRPDRDLRLGRAGARRPGRRRQHMGRGRQPFVDPHTSAVSLLHHKTCHPQEK